MDKSNFSRWAKTNIEENEFYDEGKDWWGFVIVTNGNECRDYKFTTDFAKHLSMSSRSAKGKIARDYFVYVEDGAKKMLVQFQDMSPQLQYMIKVEQEQKRKAK
ncbi:antA/AntB antirepressor family protein [Lacrimispora aerotolerans]|uniref:antA/AntB antirepressor family protein n=1 Tax=Lacrimispora aerotolerans TaxID=36832 RepID=UPI001A9A46FC|nr:antA/AntB antirepressor family protein [Lacrimispora aerotolerans]